MAVERVHLGPPLRGRRDVVSGDRTRPLAVDEAAVRAILGTVADPEIPSVSIVDLGMVERVDVDVHGIEVELLPTFVGCPAQELIRGAVIDALAPLGRPTTVGFTFRVPWTSERITERGRGQLASAGFAPPAGRLPCAVRTAGRGGSPWTAPSVRPSAGRSSTAARAASRSRRSSRSDRRSARHCDERLITCRDRHMKATRSCPRRPFA